MSAVENTEAKILAAAAALIAERGYAATTTRAIAERAGVNEVTLFRRFGNKLGVLEALAASWMPNMAGYALDDLPTLGDTLATLRELADREVTQSASAGPAATRLVLDARTTPELAALIGSGPSGNHASLAAYVSERQAAGDLRQDLSADVIAEAFFALTSGVIMSRQVMSGESEPPYGMTIHEAAGQLLEIFMAGVGTTGADSAA